MKNDKRSLIMSAAERLFTSCRFHEIKLDDVAREAKVGKGTIYLYFKDKDDLFFQTAINGIDELIAIIETVTSNGTTFHDELTSACTQVNAFFDNRRELFRMLEDEEARAFLSRNDTRRQWLEKRRPLVAAVASIIRKGIEKGIVRPDVQTEILADYLLGMLRTRARDLEKAPESARTEALIIDLFCNGVCKR